MRVADYLDTAAARYPDRAALIFGNARISYGEAKRFVHAVAHSLKREAMLTDAAHVAIYSANDHRVPLLQIGANRADMAWIGVHDRNSIETNAEVLKFMDCEALFFNSVYETEIPRLKTLLPAIKLWVCIDQISTHAPSLEQWMEGSWTEFPYVTVDRDRIACIAPTGGTTGPSKGAVHSHHSLEMEIVSLSSCLALNESTRMLTAAPLSHAAAHFALGLLPLGGTNVIVKGFDPELVLQTIATERITHFFAPPTLVYMLLAHPSLSKTDTSSLTHLIAGAAPFAPEKFKQAVRLLGPILYEVYGQSESAIPILVKRPSDYMGPSGLDEAAARTSGRAAPNVRIEIMDDDGRLLPRGEVGEIVLRSSMGMSGYYKNPQATQGASKFGFHHTGDIGVMDEHGLVTIIDRKKDMIITGGFNVFPAEVEAVVNEHASVLDCIVVGVPDEKWGESVKAVVQLKAGCSASEVEIIDLCRRRLGGVKAPKSVEIRADLPRSAVGKLLRREIRQQYWKGHWRSV